MNRIILIGNGFDLAHGLKTSYKDFMDDYWENEIDEIQKWIKTNYDKEKYYDIDIQIHSRNIDFLSLKDPKDIEGKGYNKLISWLVQASKVKLTNDDPFSDGSSKLAGIEYRNKFLERITDKYSLENWIDIEREYFEALKECLNKKKDINVTK